MIIKPFNAIWPQITWQVKTEARLTISYNLYVICSEHLYEKSVYNEI